MKKIKLKIKMTHTGVVSVDLSGDNGTKYAEGILNELKNGT